MRLLYYVLSILLFSSCMSYKDVQFNGISGFKVDEVNKERIAISFDANIYNPNNYNIKVKADNLDLLLSDKVIGKAKVKDNIVIKKNSTDAYRVEIETSLKSVAGGGLSSLFKLVTGGPMNIQIRGVVKAKARGLGKKFEIDETRSFNPKDLDLKLPF